MTLNDAELRMLTGEPNLARAARKLARARAARRAGQAGPVRRVHVHERGYFSIPAYPLETVIDPTGAGDSFAGGCFGYLDSLGEPDRRDNAFRAAAVYGSVLASFAVEDFGTERVQRLTEEEVAARFAEFKRMMTFDEPVARRLGERRSSEVAAEIERPRRRCGSTGRSRVARPGRVVGEQAGPAPRARASCRDVPAVVWDDRDPRVVVPVPEVDVLRAGRSRVAVVRDVQAGHAGGQAREARRPLRARAQRGHHVIVARRPRPGCPRSRT